MIVKRSSIIFSLVLVVAAAPFARAEGSLSDAELDAIRNNCVTAQIGLQHVQESDKLTRINRGFRYESILRLMANFNSRVAQNKLNAPDLISVTSEYQKGWNEFRALYTEYDDELTVLIGMECRNELTTFSDRLIKLREKRGGLSESVKTFDGLFDKYQQGVDALKQSQKVSN